MNRPSHGLCASKKQPHPELRASSPEDVSWGLAKTNLRSHSGDPIILDETNDLYGYHTPATALADMLLRTRTPLVVGWGVRTVGRGKTSYMDTVRARIAVVSPNSLHIRFSPWNFQLKSFDDVWIALITEFSSQNKQEKPFAESLGKRIKEINYWKVSKNVLEAGSSFLPIGGEAAKKVLELFPGGAQKNEFQQFLETKEVFDEAVRAYLKGHEGHRVFIYIDDIDRCEPAVSVYVLRAIQVLCRTQGCVFLLGLDRDVIIGNLKKTYDDPNFAREYLDKIVQLHIELPRIEIADLQNVIRFRANGEERTGIAPFPPWIASIMDFNPRKIERFVFLFD